MEAPLVGAQRGPAVEAHAAVGTGETLLARQVLHLDVLLHVVLLGAGVLAGAAGENSCSALGIEPFLQQRVHQL